MRLLQYDNDDMLRLVEHTGNDIPPYAILSHTWGSDEEEVTFSDIIEGSGKSKTGYTKISFCRDQAIRDGLEYFWVDTCCIDKSSSAELSEAINSMFRWYRNAATCYVFLSDVTTHDLHTDELSSLGTWESTFRKSRWFTRGWTLQELLAPVSVEFFSREGKRLGDKTSLEQQIHEITGIAIRCLRGDALSSFSIEERMSWASRRYTKRQEDNAYCLLGIFDVHMPLIYGEGGRNAYIRLREEFKGSFKRKEMRIEGDEIPGDIRAAAFDQLGTQADPKPMELKRTKGPQDAKDWPDSANRRNSSENWESVKDIISRLYLDEGRPLVEVMNLMRSMYGLSAGKAQYERKFKQWQFRKNLKRSDWMAISRTVQQRKILFGKDTAVHFNGSLISVKKLKKEMSRSTYNMRHSESDIELLEDVRATTPEGVRATTPEGVRIITPPQHHLYHTFGATQFENLPWLRFQDMLAMIVDGASTNEGTTEPPFVSTGRKTISLVDIMNITQSILATFIPNEISAPTAPTLQSTYSRIRALIPERYPQEFLPVVEKIFSTSLYEVLQGSLHILILLCSNNFISDQQTYQATSLAYTGGAGSLLMSVFSIRTPTVAEFANRLFRGALDAEDLELVRLMIHGPLPLSPSSMLPEIGMTPLQLAVARGNIGLIKVLLEAGSSPNNCIQEYVRTSALREASIQRDLNGNENSTYNVVKSLARTMARNGHTNVNLNRFDSLEGSSKDHASTPRSTAPIDIARPENLEGASIGNAEAKSTGTPLQIATKAGSLDIVELLLQYGAEINANPAMSSGMTALQTASRAGNLDVVRLLLDAGADVNGPAALHSGMTALQAASRAGGLDVVKLLLDAGADVNGPAALHSGMTALQAASRAGSLDVVKLLLGAGADANALPALYSGMTALQAASRAGSLDVVRLLLDAGADVNGPAALHSGMTALQAASRAGSLDVVKLLLDAGADPDGPAAVYSRMTAIQIATESGNIGIVEILLGAGAQINNPLAPEHGQILLQTAASHGYVGIFFLFWEDVMSWEANIALSCLETAIEGAAEHGRLDMVYLLYNLYKAMGGVEARLKAAGTLAMRNGYHAVAELLSAESIDMG